MKVDQRQELPELPTEAKQMIQETHPLLMKTADELTTLAHKIEQHGLDVLRPRRKREERSDR